MAGDGDDEGYSKIRQYAGLVLCLVCVFLTILAPMAEKLHPMLDSTYSLILILLVALYALYLHETRPVRRMNYGEFEEQVTAEAKEEIAQAKKSGKKESKKGK